MDRVGQARRRGLTVKLARLYPDARIELGIFIFSARTLGSRQSCLPGWDRKLNEETRALFSRYHTAADCRRRHRAELEKVIEPTGSLLCQGEEPSSVLARRYGDRFGGEVRAKRGGGAVALRGRPQIPEHGSSAMHLRQAAHRGGYPFRPTGATSSAGPRRPTWTRSSKRSRRSCPARVDVASHRVIWHGRRVCHAAGRAAARAGRQAAPVVRRGSTDEGDRGASCQDSGRLRDRSHRSIKARPARTVA